ncbi:MAG: putative lipid II flippase FtsW [Anaerolineae bacterium]
MTIGRRRERFDYLLVIIVATLLIIGLMMVYSATFDLAYREFGEPLYFFIRQVVWTSLGAAILLLFSRVEYHRWQRLSIPILAFALVLLVAVLLVGGERFGAQRSFWKGSIQPSEFGKLAVVIYIADWLSSKREKIRHITYGLIPFAILIGVVAGLIVLQPDFGTAILIVATTVAMFFVAGADLMQLAISFVVGGATFALLITRSAHASARISSFLESLSNPYSSDNYHLRQALIALGSGGVAGRGLGDSRQKFGYLPLSHTDSIFAVLGEELGLIGCLIVILLFAALAYRGFRIALRAPDDFGTVLASGITFWLIFQALVNIAVVTATLPITGIPLPFISFGGSALATSLAGVGLLLSISRGSGEEGESANSDFRRWDRRARLPRSGGR